MTKLDIVLSEDGESVVLTILPDDTKGSNKLNKALKDSDVQLALQQQFPDYYRLDEAISRAVSEYNERLSEIENKLKAAQEEERKSKSEKSQQSLNQDQEPVQESESDLDQEKNQKADQGSGIETESQSEQNEYVSPDPLSENNESVESDEPVKPVEPVEPVEPDEPDEPDEPIKIIIAEIRDHVITIDITPDEMEATLSITVGYACPPVNLPIIQKKLDQYAISFGVKNENIEQLLDQLSEAKPGSQHRILIAQGEEPENGLDTQFEQIAKTLKDRILKPIINKNGSADMRSLGVISEVHPGDVLMKRNLPTSGNNGCTVTHKVVYPKAGEDIPFDVAEGSCVSDDDPNILVAQITGLASLFEHGMSVKPIIELDNIDLSSGNIDFDGDLIVSSDIKKGMHVKVTGNVVVHGYVEQAQIEASGDVFIEHGLFGQPLSHGENVTIDHTLDASVICGGEVRLRFAQYADINAKKSVWAKEMLLHCLVTTQDSVIVGEENPNSHLVGGIIHAMHSVSAGIVGAPAMIKTVIDFTPKYAELRKQIMQIKNDMEVQHAQFKKLKSILEQLTGLKKDHPSRAKSVQIVKTFNNTKKLLGVIHVEYKAIQDEMNMLQKAKLNMQKQIYPGVTVKIANKSYTVNSTFGKGCVCYHSGKIVCFQQETS